MMKVVSISGNSMQPTLQSGERVLAYTPLTKRQLRRNAIVTVSHFETHVSADPLAHAPIAERCGQSALFIKRIVGLPNDEIRIPACQLSQHILPMIDPLCIRAEDEYRWQVAENHVFVRGDAAFSIDSVVWGPIPITQIQQIILCRFPSFQPIR